MEDGMSHPDAYAVEIEIYCDDASHPQRVSVHRLRGHWGTTSGGRRVATSWVASGAALMGDDLQSDADMASIRDEIQRNPEHDPALRSRDDFRCDQCGTTVVVRSEKLSPVLDKLLFHGVSEISLTALQARLSK
jgi:hypothetical protein